MSVLNGASWNFSPKVNYVLHVFDLYIPCTIYNEQHDLKVHLFLNIWK